MLDCIWNPPDLTRKPPSMSCEVWVFSAKLPGMGLKKASKEGPDDTRSSTFGVRNARAARPNTENTLLKRCSRPICRAYWPSSESSGKFWTLHEKNIAQFGSFWRMSRAFRVVRCRRPPYEKSVVG